MDKADRVSVAFIPGDMVWEAQSPGQGILDSCVWLRAHGSPCPALGRLLSLLIITKLSHPKAWAALLTMDRLPCSHWSRVGGQQSRWHVCRWKGEDTGGSYRAAECLPVPRDPIRGTTWLQTPTVAPLDALDCSTSCSVSLDSHWLWEGGRALSTSKPVLGLGCVSSLVRTRGNETEKHN